MSIRQVEFGSQPRLLPTIGQGTRNMELDDSSAAIAALEAGLDAGMTHVDTAELYGSGRVERLVSRAIEGRRDDLFLVSKVLPHNAGRAKAIAACERSLKRLGTDRLDLYLLHWRGSVPLAETIEAFERLIADGKILAYGVSNFDVGGLEEAAAIAGARRIVCNQVLYHLAERSIEHTVIPWCREHGIAVVAYSPFGSGHFPSPETSGGRVLKEIAAVHAVTPHAVALAFLIEHGGVFTIPKTSKVEHVLQNAAAGDLSLTDEEILAIDGAFPAKRRRDLAMI